MSKQLAASLAAALVTTGCLMPNGGTPVLVDSRSGRFWSGKGVMTEVSPDQKQCKVAIRDRALFVHHEWYDCKTVHPRVGRD
jgi:hypothetical protein